MNMDDINAKPTDLSKKLTMLSNERARTETESLGFNSQEYDNMQEFFNKELKQNDAKEMLRTVQIMFKNIRSQKFKRYFVEVLTKHVRYFCIILFYRKPWISSTLQTLSSWCAKSLINRKSSSFFSMCLLTTQTQ